MQLRAIERWAEVLRHDRGDTRWTTQDRQAIDDVYTTLSMVMERARSQP